MTEGTGAFAKAEQVRGSNFPYLTIAKLTGEDYGSILRTAHWMKFGGDMTIEINCILDDWLVANLTYCAVQQMCLIQSGALDWLTKQPKNTTPNLVD